jgi:hypothetical protein
MAGYYPKESDSSDRREFPSIIGELIPQARRMPTHAERATVLRRSYHLCGLVVEIPEPHVMRVGRVRRIIDKNMYRKRGRLYSYYYGS